MAYLNAINADGSTHLKDLKGKCRRKILRLWGLSSDGVMPGGDCLLDLINIAIRSILLPVGAPGHRGTPDAAKRVKIEVALWQIVRSEISRRWRSPENRLRTGRDDEPALLQCQAPDTAAAVELAEENLERCEKFIQWVKTRDADDYERLLFMRDEEIYCPVCKIAQLLGWTVQKVDNTVRRHATSVNVFNEEKRAKELEGPGSGGRGPGDGGQENSVAESCPAPS
jgi:hypothetical protein